MKSVRGVPTIRYARSLLVNANYLFKNIEGELDSCQTFNSGFSILFAFPRSLDRVERHRSTAVGTHRKCR